MFALWVGSRVSLKLQMLEQSGDDPQYSQCLLYKSKNNVVKEKTRKNRERYFEHWYGYGIEDRGLAGKIQVKFRHKFMPDGGELLNLLEEVGLLLLDSSLLHRSFVCPLDIKNNELPCQCFKTASFSRLCYSLLGFLQLESSNNKCASTHIIQIYHNIFLLNMLVLLLGQLTFNCSKCDLYYYLEIWLSVLEHNTPHSRLTLFRYLIRTWQGMIWLPILYLFLPFDKFPSILSLKAFSECGKCPMVDNWL